MNRPSGWPWLFLLPCLAGWTLLTGGPLIGTALISLFEPMIVSGRTHWRFVGVENFQELVRGHAGSTGEGHAPTSAPTAQRWVDTRFGKSVYNSLAYTSMAATLEVGLALTLALLLSGTTRAAAVLRACVFLPTLLTGVATLMIWSWMFNPRFGPVNEGIRALYAVLDPWVRWFNSGGTSNWPEPGWLHSPTQCRLAAALIHVWSTGGTMLVLVAALRRVPQSLIDASLLDGALGCRRFIHVVLPIILPLLLFCMGLSCLFCLQSFNESYLLGNRDQRDGLLLVSAYLYELAFEPPYRLGYASAVALSSLIGISILVVPIFLLARAAGRRLKGC